MTSIAAINYEEKHKYKIKIRVEDSEGLTAPEDLDIEVHINDENEPPTWNLDKRTFMLNETASGGELIADMSVSDPDSDKIDYTMTVGDDDLFRVDGEGNIYIQSEAQFDYEAITSYTITIKAQESETVEQNFVKANITINIIDVNDMKIGEIHPLKLDTAGNQVITFSGTELGPLDDHRIEGTTVTAYYNGPDGVIYNAKDCSCIGFV